MIEIINMDPFLVAGIFGSIGKILGFGNDDASEAANLIAAANDKSKVGLKEQFGRTEANITPFIQAGANALPEIVQSATVGGLNERLAEIFNSDIFSALSGERRNEVNAGLSAGGLTRAGGGIEALANIPAEIGLFLENLLTQRSAGLAEGGKSAAFGLGSFGENLARDVSGITQQTGQAQASGLLGDAQANAAGLSNLFGGVGAGISAFAQPKSVLAGVGSGLRFFSDPRLKKNVFVVGEVMSREGIVLKVHKWDWIAKAKGTIVEKCATVGFMADEVKEKFPHHVFEYCGLDVINYPGLISELEGV